MASIEWETPWRFFNTLNLEFGFTLDVCANSKNAKCSKYFSPLENGLYQKWSGVCWMNPPYNHSISKWMAKAYESACEGVTVVCLIQCRSGDTKWWHNFVMRSSEIRFVKGRLQFLRDGKTGSGSNISSVVVIFRPFCIGPPKTMSIDTDGKIINHATRPKSI